MEASKNEFLKKLADNSFLDLDTCCLCGSHNGPFVWVIESKRRKGIRTYFVCEECYEKKKG